MAGPRISRRGFLGAGAATAAAIAVPGSGAAAATPDIPTADELLETGPLQPRDLSLPMSRLCINPKSGGLSQTPLQYSLGPDVPLHLSYHCSDRWNEMFSVTGIYRRAADQQGEVTIAYEDPFDAQTEGWVPSEGLTVEYAAGHVTLTNSANAPNWFGTYSRDVELNLDETPYVQIAVNSVADAWGITVNDGGGDVVVQKDYTKPGAYTYDLRQSTGWSGTVSFRISIRVAVKEMPAELDFFRFAGVTPVLTGTQASETSWLPYKVPLHADYASGVAADTVDFMGDVNVAVRRYDVTPAEGWALTGQFFEGTLAWDAANHVLTLTRETYAYAVAFAAPIEGELRRYPTLLELLAQTDPVGPDVTTGFWTLDLGSVDGPLVTAVGFATIDEGGAEVAASRARAFADVTVDPDRQQALWDDYLARVPHPRSFELPGIDPKGSTPEQIRRSYYRAWVSTHNHVIPAQPEIGYDYPQLAAGPPSPYVGGPTGAQATALWDSLYGMQFYAYYDVATTWSTYKGMMSIVPEDGALDGEALASQFAHTAWILYDLSGDRESLREIYDPLKRLLLWKEQNPRWILPDHHDNPYEKGNGSCVSIVIDFRYAAQIARVLDLDDEAAMWEDRREKFFRDNYLTWFFETPDGPPYEYYFTDTGTRSSPSALGAGGALQIDLWNGDEPQLATLLPWFGDRWDPNVNFVKFTTPKYPGVSGVVFGLLQHGMHEEATITEKVMARDIARAGLFAEYYYIWDNPPVASGSGGFFGICLQLDSVLMLNGYRAFEGWPRLVTLDDTAPGGVDGLTVRGKVLNIATDPANETITVSGSLVPGHSRTLSVPLGKTVTLPWRPA